MIKEQAITMKYTPIIASVGAVLTAGIIFSSPAMADANPSCSVLPQSICNSTGTTDSKDVSKSGIFQILIWVLRIMTGAVGVAAVGALTYAGILYSSAGSKNEQVVKAKTIITDTSIGIVVYGLMFFILNWLIPGGVFGS